MHQAGDSQNKALQTKSALIIPLWLVWLAALGFIFAGLGSYGILDNNEGLYAEIPREMLASHDWRMWIIPHLNGLPYMEKPPLLYWLTALSFELFGISEWSARLVPALSSLACVGLLLRFGQAMQRPLAGRLAALIFVSGIGVAVMSRTLMFDMLLTVTLCAALMYAYRYHVEKKSVLLRKAYACLALALMAKGVVAVLLFGLVVAGLLLYETMSSGNLVRTCRAWLEPGAVLTFVLVAAPWHIAASMVEPIFPWFYFVNEHVLRFLGKREPHDYYAGSWWYYLPRMAIYMFPWSFLLPGLWQKKQTVMPVGEQKGLQRFLFLAWLLPLIFFSVSSAKANYYLVLVMPFAALQLAIALENRDFLIPRFRLLPGVLIALLFGALTLILTSRTQHALAELVIAGLPATTFACGVLASLCGLAILSSWFAVRFPRIGVQAYLMLPAWSALALIIAVHAVEPMVSTRPLAAYLQTELPGRSVYLYQHFEEQSSLPFYLQKSIGVIDSHSNDLFWGNKLQRNDLLITSAQFEKNLHNQNVAVVVLKNQIKEFTSAAFYSQFKGQKQVGIATVFFN